jgi:hypothetical protein
MAFINQLLIRNSLKTSGFLRAVQTIFEIEEIFEYSNSIDWDSVQIRSRSLEATLNMEYVFR